MVLDMTIVREVWDGGIVARFTLASHEVTGPETPSPFYLTLPRNSYLPVFNEKVHNHFSSFVKKNDSDVWFDYNGCPLKWHYPIGILFDTLSVDKKKTMEITVHFQDFPEESLIRCHDNEAIEAHFMSTLKEADRLKHRGQAINSLNKSQHKQLWNSLKNDNFEQFWSINSKLMEGHESTGGFKYVPLRIYDQQNVLQHLFAPVDEGNAQITLFDCLKGMFQDRDFDHCRFVLHGIDVPLDSKMQWLSTHLSYADNFLHVAIVNGTV